MPSQSSSLGLDGLKTNGHMSTLSLRIKIPQTAAAQLESLAKKNVDNPLRKLGIVRVCLDGENSIEISPNEPVPLKSAEEPNNNRNHKSKSFSEALIVDTGVNVNINQTSKRKTAKQRSQSSTSSNTSKSPDSGKKKPAYPRSKDVLPLGPSYIRNGAISPKPAKKKRDPSSHPPFDCDLPLDIPYATSSVSSTNGAHPFMSQLSNQNGSSTSRGGGLLLPTDQTSASQGVISAAAIIMSNLAQYEHAIEAVIHKAASGQDLACYLVEIDPTADLDSIPPATPKSVDLNAPDTSSHAITDQADSMSSNVNDQSQAPNEIQGGATQLQMPPTPSQMPPPQQTMTNTGLVVRTVPGPVPTMPGTVLTPHGTPMGMHGRTVWGYDAGAPSPHGTYILASPNDAAAIGFAHDPMAGRHPSPVKLTSPMMTKMSPQSPYGPILYGAPSPYGRHQQVSPYGAPHPSSMGQFSPNFPMTSPIGAPPGMNPYAMVPQMGKTQAQMIQQQQHSPIAATVHQQQQHSMSPHQNMMSSTLTTKDFLPSLQHSQSQNSGGAQDASGMMHSNYPSMTSSSDMMGGHPQMISNSSRQQPQIQSTINSRTTPHGHNMHVPPSTASAAHFTIVSVTPSSHVTTSIVPSNHSKVASHHSEIHSGANGQSKQGNKQLVNGNHNPYAPKQNLSGHQDSSGSGQIASWTHMSGSSTSSDSRPSKLNHSKTSTLTSSGSLPFGSMDEDATSESSPSNSLTQMPPPSPAPSAGSSKQGQATSSCVDVISDDQSLARCDDVNLSEFDSATRKLLADFVQDFEKNRSRCETGESGNGDPNAHRSRMVTPVNTFSSENSEHSSMTLSDQKIVTEIRIPAARNNTEQVITDTIMLSKTVPVINTSSAVSSPEKREKKKRDNTDKSRTKTSNSSTDDRKTSKTTSNELALRKFTQNSVSLDHSSSNMLHDSGSCFDFGASFDSQATSGFASSFLGTSHDNNLFSQLEPGSIFNPNDLETTGSEMLNQQNMMRAADLEGVENDEHCGKLLAQILESNDSNQMSTSDFANVLNGPNSVARSMSQPSGFPGDNNRMKSIHGITESFGISEYDINLLQQSMDMAQASGNSPASKARKRCKSQTTSKAALGEPSAKAVATTVPNAAKAPTVAHRAQVAKSATPTPAPENGRPGSATPENQLSKSNPETSLSSMKFESVINKVLSEQSGVKSSMTEIVDSKASNSSVTSSVEKTAKNSDHISRAKVVGNGLSAAISESGSPQRAASAANGRTLAFADRNMNSSDLGTNKSATYASSLPMNGQSSLNNPIISDHQYIKQQPDLSSSTATQGDMYMHMQSSFAPSVSHTLDSQQKFFPSVVPRSHSDFSSHIPTSPISSNYGNHSSPLTEGVHLSNDMMMRRTKVTDSEVAEDVKCVQSGDSTLLSRKHDESAAELAEEKPSEISSTAESEEKTLEVPVEEKLGGTPRKPKEQISNS